MGIKIGIQINSNTVNSKRTMLNLILGNNSLYWRGEPVVWRRESLSWR